MMSSDKSNFVLWGKGSPNNNPIPKIVWIYWEGSSELVNRCLEKVKSTLIDFKVNILDNSNLHDILPELPKKNNDLPLANYADLIRLALLAKYGGIWIDASILLTEKLDWLTDLKEQYKTDVIGFYADSFTTDLQNPILENYFLAAPKKNAFILRWYNEYVQCYSSEFPKSYYSSLYENNKLQGLDKNLAQYLLPYLSAIQIMLNDNSYRILMLPSNLSAHYYNFNLNLKPHQLCEVFLFNKRNQKCPRIIKFEKRGRQAIDEAIERGQYDRNSLLYKISPDPHYLKNKLPRYFKYISFITQNILKRLK